jgi:hypothetical protein
VSHRAHRTPSITDVDAPSPLRNPKKTPSRAFSPNAIRPRRKSLCAHPPPATRSDTRNRASTSQNEPHPGILGYMKNRSSRCGHLRIVANLAIVATLIACADSARAADHVACPHPAPVDNRLDPSLPSVFATVRSGVDLFELAARIAHTYSIQPRVLPAVHMLVIAPVTEAWVTRLRCEPDLEQLSYDVRFHIG